MSLFFIHVGGSFSSLHLPLWNQLNAQNVKCLHIVSMDGRTCHLLSVHIQLGSQIHPSRHVNYCWQFHKSYCVCALSGQLAVSAQAGGDGGGGSCLGQRPVIDIWTMEQAHSSLLTGGGGTMGHFLLHQGRKSHYVGLEITVNYSELA